MKVRIYLALGRKDDSSLKDNNSLSQNRKKIDHNSP
jgi:hypothetical protein